MKFRDLPQFTKSAQYSVSIPWEYLERTLESYNEDGKLQLDPEFQRAHVWNQAKQIAYVEFVLRGGKSSRDIYFNMRGWMSTFSGPMYLVDGKQRLESVRAFLRGDIPVFGAYFAAFEDRLPLEASFTFQVNDLKNYSEVLQWYLDLNAGGVVHTSEELDKVRAILRAEIGSESLKGKRHA